MIKRKPDSIFDYRFEDFEIQGYDPHPGIKAPCRYLSKYEPGRSPVSQVTMN